MAAACSNLKSSKMQENLLSKNMKYTKYTGYLMLKSTTSVRYAIISRMKYIRVWLLSLSIFNFSPTTNEGTEESERFLQIYLKCKQNNILHL